MPSARGASGRAAGRGYGRRRAGGRRRGGRGCDGRRGRRGRRGRSTPGGAGHRRRGGRGRRGRRGRCAPSGAGHRRCGGRGSRGRCRGAVGQAAAHEFLPRRAAQAAGRCLRVAVAHALLLCGLCWCRSACGGFGGGGWRRCGRRRCGGRRAGCHGWPLGARLGHGRQRKPGKEQGGEDRSRHGVSPFWAATGLDCPRTRI